MAFVLTNDKEKKIKVNPQDIRVETITPFGNIALYVDGDKFTYWFSKSPEDLEKKKSNMDKLYFDITKHIDTDFIIEVSHYEDI